MKRMPAGSWRSAVLLPLLLWLSSAAASDYTPCTDAAAHPGLQGSLCARESVAASPDGTGGQVSLFLRKFPAAGASKGSVWAIAGGPGESGASLYPFVAVLQRSFPGYDLVIPDHRGTGVSTRLCPVEEAVSSPGGPALAGAEWGSCLARLAAEPALAQQFSITHAAHDLRQLIARERPQGKPIYLYAVSYGTQLVLRALQMGPLPLRGVVLDSLVPPETDPRWDLSRRSLVVDDIGRHVLAACDKDAACAASEPIATVYRRLLAKGRADPSLFDKVPGKDLARFLGALLDMPALRARIPYLIRDLDGGRGGELEAVSRALPAIQAAFGAYPPSPSSIPLVGIISKSENNLRPALTQAALQREEADLLFTSALPGLLVTSTLPSYPRDAWFGLHPAALPPTLVLQGTLDPKTHYDGARAHVAALREHGKLGLVSVEGAPHFILWTAPSCFERQVAAFVTKNRLLDARCILP